jgi:hypothetical protein
MSRKCVLVIGLCACLLTKSQAADRPTETELLLRHEEGLANIKSLSGKYTSREVLADGKLVTISEGGFFVEGERSAILTGKAGKAMAKTVSDNGQVRIVHRSWVDNGQVSFAATRLAASELTTHGDVFQQMMCSKFPSDGQSLLSLSDLHRLAVSGVEVSETTHEGRKCVKVDFRYEVDHKYSIRISHWHDIHRQYLITRREMLYSNSGLKVVFEMQDFLEENGGTFPTRRVAKQYLGDGVLSKHFELTLSDVAINRALPKDAFVLPTIPAGTECLDKIKSQTYPIDSNWTQSGPSKPFIVYGVDSGPTDQATADFGNQPSSVEAPDRTALYVMLASGGVLVAAGVLCLIRRLQRRA